MNAHAEFACPSLIGEERAYVVSANPLTTWIGFYYSIRLICPLLAVRILRKDPQDGVMASLILNYFLLMLVALCSFRAVPHTIQFILRLPCVRWVIMFICFSGASLFWSVTASRPAAIAFWCAMAADTVIIILLLRDGDADAIAEALMQGYVWGSCVIAMVAWSLPRQSDLRLGDEELLGPNQIGWACAFALLLAQYLVRRGKRGGVLPAVLLAITVLRSLSKTTLVALVAGEGYLLIADKSMSRRTKLLLGASTVLALAVFYELISQYFTIYINAGSQSETLTGRLGIWLYIFNEAIQKPWIGHGFHSVWKVIPPFGEFEARHAHNELLQQFYSYGTVGVCMLIAIYGSVWRKIRHIDNSRKVLLTSILICVIVRGLADTEVFDLSLPLWFVVIIGSFIERTHSYREALA